LRGAGKFGENWERALRGERVLEGIGRFIVFSVVWRRNCGKWQCCRKRRILSWKLLDESSS
jgi:hypothetical protein